MAPSPSNLAVALQPDLEQSAPVSQAIIPAELTREQANIHGQTITTGNFQYTTLRDCTINKSSLKNCKLDNCIILDNSSLVSSKLYNSEIDGSKATNCAFYTCRKMANSVVLDSTLRNTISDDPPGDFDDRESPHTFYRNCKFDSCDIAHSKLRQSEFHGGSLHLCFMETTSTENTTMEDCNLLHCKVKLGKVSSTRIREGTMMAVEECRGESIYFPSLVRFMSA